MANIYRAEPTLRQRRTASGFMLGLMLLRRGQFFRGLSRPKETALPQVSHLPTKTGLEAVELTA